MREEMVRQWNTGILLEWILLDGLVEGISESGNAGKLEGWWRTIIVEGWRVEPAGFDL